MCIYIYISINNLFINIYMSQLLNNTNMTNEVFDIYCNSLNANQINSSSLITATFGSITVPVEGAFFDDITISYYKIGKQVTINFPEYVRVATVGNPIEIIIPNYLYPAHNQNIAGPYGYNNGALVDNPFVYILEANVGLIRIAFSLTNENFTMGANCGIEYGASITYISNN